MTHYKDTSLSEDPEIQDLQLQLCDLASMFGASQYPEEIAKEYRTVITELYSLGWDGVVSMDCALPNAYMPEEYLMRNPEITDPSRNMAWFPPEAGNTRE